MLLEVAAEERLVGEVVFLGYFFHGEGGGLQGHLQFQHQHFVDDVFGRVLPHLLRDGREVTGGDAEPLGIEAHVALRGAVGVRQVDELLEQLLLAVVAIGLPGCEQALHLVVGIQEEDLQQVLSDGFAETVFRVVGGYFCQLDEAPDGLPALRFGADVARIVLQVAEEGRLDAEAGSLEQPFGEGEVADTEVGACGGEREDGIGQHDHARVGEEAVLFEVERDGGLPLLAEQHRTIVYPDKVSGKGTQVVGPASETVLCRGLQWIHIASVGSCCKGTFLFLFSDVL